MDLRHPEGCCRTVLLAPRHRAVVAQAALVAERVVGVVPYLVRVDTLVEVLRHLRHSAKRLGVQLELVDDLLEHVARERVHGRWLNTMGSPAGLMRSLRSAAVKFTSNVSAPPCALPCALPLSPQPRPRGPRRAPQGSCRRTLLPLRKSLPV
jgi:hypothetical protein